jgi:hypothetical protein
MSRRNASQPCPDIDQTVQIDNNNNGYAGFEVDDYCSDGTLTYTASSWVGDVTENPFSVLPGDKVGALITDSAAGNIRVQSEDLTSHETLIQTGTQPAGGYYAWGIDDGPSPIPTFTSVPFQVTVNGHPLSQESPTSYEMYNGSDLIVSTGPIDAAGNEFTTKFVASS